MDIKRCIIEKVKNFNLFFLFLIVGSINNTALTKIQFEKIKKIQISGLNQSQKYKTFRKYTQSLNLKNNFTRKPFFVWSVQRSKGLDEVLDVWIEKIYPNNKKLKFYIFGLKDPRIERFNLTKLEKYNIFL